MDETNSEPNDVDRRIRVICATLESVANSFPSDSSEAIAIRDAALAYATVHLHGNLRRSYEQLRSASGGEIPGEVKDRLRRLGIDPDRLDDE